MSTEKFLNVIAQQALVANNGSSFVTTGIISAYDPANHLVKVQTDAATEDYPAVTTGWIQWATPTIGIYAAPVVGCICSVYYRDGSGQAPFATNAFYGNNNVALSVPSGEIWIVNGGGSGTFIKLTNDGKVLVNGNLEIDLTTPTLNITVTGTCNLKATVLNLGNTSGDLEKLINAKFKANFDTHTHGGGPVPDEPISPDEITSNVRAT